MKLYLLALLSLTSVNFVLAQGEEDITFQPIEPYDNVNISTDFLIRLQLSIADARIPNYLIGAIYNRPVEKAISSQAVLDLYRADSINLTTTENILELLNITHSQVFSLNGLNYTLETLNWTFTNFYNTVTNRLNLTGVSLRNALVTLGIDSAAFSEGITYGVPDPWLEFIKGNFTRENIELACADVNITLEDIWAGIRNLFISDLITFEIPDFVQFLLNHTITEPRALLIWNAVPVTLQHVNSLSLFNNILVNFSNSLSAQTVLGVLTSFQQAVIHRSSYDFFREESQYLDIQIETLLSRTQLPVSVINETIYQNLVVVAINESVTNNDLTIVNVANSNSDLTNCSYITFQNNNILTANVPTARYFNETYEIPRTVIQNVFPGSALVCSNTVFGLVRGVEGDLIIADAFSDYIAPDSSSSRKLLANSALGLFILLAMKLFNF